MYHEILEECVFVLIFSSCIHYHAIAFLLFASKCHADIFVVKGL